MKIYETLSSHHQEDLETLDNLDYLAEICEQLKAWPTVNILRQQATDLRTKIFIHDHSVTVNNQPGGSCANRRIQT